MNHKELAQEFNNFAYNLNKNIDNISFIKKSDEIFYRVCIQKIYYALYHIILHYDKNLESSTGTNKHSTILSKLSSSNNTRLYQLFRKLKSLREWADYDTNNAPPGINITYLLNQVYSIIKSKKISI